MATRNTPAVAALARVMLWGHDVGAVSELPNGRVVFNYTPGFRAGGLEISPVHLPLTRRGSFEFPSLRRVEAFNGLPGVLADALPDRFGNEIIRQYFVSKGEPDKALSPVQRLLYIGKRAVGALEFEPALSDRRTVLETQALEVKSLVDQARRVIEGKGGEAVREIMQVGSSAGGARAKAIILWNQKKNQVRSAHAKPRVGDEHWIIKFDGVGELGKPDFRHQSYNRIEYVYSLLAKKAGIRTQETYLLEEGDLAHFMIKRFDRDGVKKLHVHTLGGMEHADYNAPQTYSYEQWMRLILRLNLGYPALEQAYLRTAFNLMARNQDDHVKNHSFLMHPDGRWELAPAYDLTYAKGAGYTKAHQMTLARPLGRVYAQGLARIRREIRTKGKRNALSRGGGRRLGCVAGACERMGRAHCARAGN